MAKKKIGFIGCGSMARAMVGGLLASGALRPEEIVASNRTAAKLEAAQAEFGIAAAADNCEAAAECEFLVLAVKPQSGAEVVAEIADAVPESCVVVSLLPGWTLAKLREAFGGDRKLVRAMPNTPALVREGMTALCPNGFVTPGERKELLRLFGSFGRAEVVGEPVMDAVVAVSGSSPAYVFLMIEAMADAAVAGGMKRAQAYTFAAQAVLGSAKMVLETGRHPAELKDMVCSPAGTTIEAVAALERGGFRSAVIDAMRACMDKSRSM